MVRRNYTIMHCALIATICLAGGGVQLTGAPLATFDDLSLSADSYWNGSDLSGGFTSGQADFNNNYSADWGSWDGWAYSNRTNDTAIVKGFDGQYTAVTGVGQGGSSNYGVGYCSAWAVEAPTISVSSDPSGLEVTGAYFTNTNYGYYSMLEGDFAAKKFGGADGTDADWFLLSITGLDAAGQSTGTVAFYLADFRGDVAGDDYIVSDWTWVDLSGLGRVNSLQFGLTSTDNDPMWGMNTPAYFVMDSLLVDGSVPEPATAVLLGLGTLLAARRRRRGRSL